MSAVADGQNGQSNGAQPVYKVLACMFNNMDLLDVAGPVEVLHHAVHDPKDKKTKAFSIKFVAAKEHTVSRQGASLRAHMDYEEAAEDLEDIDVLLIPGGDTLGLIEAGTTQPLELIQAYIDLQRKDPSRERTLLSICTGSLLLGKLGALQGLAATTHPDYAIKLELLCQEAARKGEYEQTDVMDDVPYVVNNARFALGEDDEENPFVFKKAPKGKERKQVARKGSSSYVEGMRRRESIARRAQLKLGGMRVITSGGITTGLDATLYLVSAMVSVDAAEEAARVMQYEWRKGVTVDGIDV